MFNGWIVSYLDGLLNGKRYVRATGDLNIGTIPLFDWFCYSGDLKSGLVQISNGQKEVGLHMKQIFNGI